MDDLKEASCTRMPKCGAEVLEEGEMEPFVTEGGFSLLARRSVCLLPVAGETASGCRDWEDRMKVAGATVVGGEGSSNLPGNTG